MATVAAPNHGRQQTTSATTGRPPCRDLRPPPGRQVAVRGGRRSSCRRAPMYHRCGYPGCRGMAERVCDDVRPTGICLTDRVAGGCAVRDRVTPGLSTAADSGPSGRCSSRRGRRAGQVAAYHRARAERDGRPRGRPVAPHAASDASPDRPSRSAPPSPRSSVAPGVARPRSAGPGGRACDGSGWRSQLGRSGRSVARSSSASRKRWRGSRSPDRRRPGGVALKRGARSGSSPQTTGMLMVAHAGDGIDRPVRSP